MESSHQPLFRKPSQSNKQSPFSSLVFCLICFLTLSVFQPSTFQAVQPSIVFSWVHGWVSKLQILGAPEGQTHTLPPEDGYTLVPFAGLFQKSGPVTGLDFVVKHRRRPDPRLTTLRQVVLAEALPPLPSVLQAGEMFFPCANARLYHQVHTCVPNLQILEIQAEVHLRLSRVEVSQCCGPPPIFPRNYLCSHAAARNFWHSQAASLYQDWLLPEATGVCEY